MTQVTQNQSFSFLKIYRRLFPEEKLRLATSLEMSQRTLERKLEDPESKLTMKEISAVLSFYETTINVDKQGVNDFLMAKLNN